MIEVGPDPDRDQSHVLFARIGRREDRGGSIVGAPVGYDDPDVRDIAAVSPAACEDIRAHGIDGAGRVRGASSVVEAERVRDRILCRVVIQVELDVRRVGVRFRSDAALPVEVQPGYDLTHKVDLLHEVRLSDAARVVQCKCDICLHTTRCNKCTRVCTTSLCAGELTRTSSHVRTSAV